MESTVAMLIRRLNYHCCLRSGGSTSPLLYALVGVEILPSRFVNRHHIENEPSPAAIELQRPCPPCSAQFFVPCPRPAVVRTEFGTSIPNRHLAVVSIAEFGSSRACSPYLFLSRNVEEATAPYNLRFQSLVSWRV